MHASRFLSLAKSAVMVALLGLSLHLARGLACSQAEWRTYTSPDKTFLVEAPAPLRKVASFDGEHGASLAPDQEYGWAISYAVIESDRGVRFGLNVVNARHRDLRSQRPELLWYLSAVLIGDEDNPDAKIQRRINVNGLEGNEYFHIRENRTFPQGGSAGEIHTRGRIFDRGDRIYVITFIGRDAKDLTSADAERFLNSFQLLKRHRRVGHRRT